MQRAGGAIRARAAMRTHGDERHGRQPRERHVREGKLAGAAIAAQDHRPGLFLHEKNSKREILIFNGVLFGGGLRGCITASSDLRERRGVRVI